jgi:iron complex transport system substrate-binding protein
MTSILDLWYLAGGTAVARVTGDESVPPEARDIEQVGGFGTPNAERIVALKPDLVILTSTTSSHRALEGVLKENGIASLYVNYQTYDDFIKYLDLFTRITGREDIFNSRIKGIQDQVDAVVQKVSKQPKPRVLILFATTKSVQSELPLSLVGDMVQILGAENIAADAAVEGAARVDFSMERVIERDPEYILVTTMGDEATVRAKVKQDLESNPAWAQLQAVKNGKVLYLDKELFIYKPNARYAEAVEAMAKILYPGVLKN